MIIERQHLYLANLNPTKGTEAGKVKTVLIIQSDLLNLEHTSTSILPCTSKLTKDNILRTRIPKLIAKNNEECEVMLDQIRSIDNKRIISKLGKLPDILMEEIERKLLLILGFKYSL